MSYQVADTTMGDRRMVRCTSCRHVWLATSSPVSVADTATGKAGAARAYDTGAGTASDMTAGRPDSEPEAAADTSLVAGDLGGFGPDSPGSAPAADGEVVENGPPLVPEDGTLPGEISASPDALAGNWDDEEELAARRAARRKLAAKRNGFPRPSWMTMILALLAVIAAILAWRAEVVRAMPQTASAFAKIGLPVNLRGLAFEDVTVERDATEGVPVLIVQGAVANAARRRVEVPRLRFSLLDARGLEVHNWTALPGRASLGPGESVEFRTRLASPPAEGRNVQIRFFTRKDR